MEPTGAKVGAEGVWGAGDEDADDSSVGVVSTGLVTGADVVTGELGAGV